MPEGSGAIKGQFYIPTLMPCYYCASAVVQFRFKKVVAAEAKNFAGAQAFLEEQGVEVIDLDLDEARQIMADFINKHPELWKEDIGEM